MSQRVKIERLLVEIILAASIGAAELIIWQRTDAGPPIWYLNLFSYPLIVGILMGVFGRGPVWIIGPATMLCLPIGMLVNMFTGAGGLNLWPVTLMFYVVLAVIGIIGATIGRGAKRCWIKWCGRHDG